MGYFGWGWILIILDTISVATGGPTLAQVFSSDLAFGTYPLQVIP